MLLRTSPEESKWSAAAFAISRWTSKTRGAQRYVRVTREGNPRFPGDEPLEDLEAAEADLALDDSDADADKDSQYPPPPEELEFQPMAETCDEP